MFRGFQVIFDLEELKTVFERLTHDRFEVMNDLPGVKHDSGRVNDDVPQARGEFGFQALITPVLSSRSSRL